MVYLYDSYYLPYAQDKLASIFELGVLERKIDIDTLASKFVSSKVALAFEHNDPTYVFGYSANELLGLILDEDPIEYEEDDYASPEYWVGYVLPFIQSNLNISYKELFDKYKASQLLDNYFPYHEMDITRILDFVKERININKLKDIRTKKGFSQNELSILSGVPIRNIRAYEQNQLDIRNAEVSTVYRLSRTLNCSIESLI